ncbi:MAG: IMP dehydrogenase [Candidatus Marinimicrobia bacterium]|nr:IMP dehydrogenase [Candidatus Neomarinimicrobiota bacterium]|tara:strand:- start:2264 stop:3730 length:1467 start_codon:yes stop_codon:yes gene_type:complete
MRVFEKKILKQALTFDDVLLIPQNSKIMPKDADLCTRLTKNLNLNIPLISAAMDTVTETKMAIAMAREGGLGVIHKNLSIDSQADMVDRVKRSESGMIINPLTISSDKCIKDALELMAKYRVSGIPIVDNGKLNGILTNRDLRFLTDFSKPISDYMTTKKNLVTVPIGTTLNDAEKILQENRIEKLLVVDKKGDLAGLITVKDILKKKQYPNAIKDSHGRLLVGAAIGTSDDTMDRTEALISAGVDVLIVDTAHAHSQGVLDIVEKIRSKFDIELIAGNIVTQGAVIDLIDRGVTGLKVGIGAGASCTTRIVAGVGVPQLSAIMECSEIASKYDIPIIADGGIRFSGDISKSIAAGAHATMIGSLFAGMEESPGETILYEGRSFKTYRGMGSISAMQDGSGDRYFQEGQIQNKLVPEGIEGMVPFRGQVYHTIYQLIGGLKSAMGYTGNKTINKMRENAKFIQITASGMKESHPHDMKITKEAPNYNL